MLPGKHKNNGLRIKNEDGFLLINSSKISSSITGCPYLLSTA
jgi:hypothetical protein